jgi:hypothetical protein
MHAHAPKAAWFTPPPQLGIAHHLMVENKLRTELAHACISRAMVCFGATRRQACVHFPKLDSSLFSSHLHDHLSSLYSLFSQIRE